MCRSSALRASRLRPRPPRLFTACQSVCSRKSPAAWQTMNTRRTSTHDTARAYRYSRRMEAGAVQELPTGHQLGRYRIDEPLSKGAMGAVYKATNIVSDEQGAVKRLIDPHHAVRFEIEA